ncbi:3'-5' exonuclease [Kitasatospora sp. NPDC001660]
MAEADGAPGEGAAVLSADGLAAELGLKLWQVSRGVELGVVPPRTTSEGWSAEVAGELRARAAEIAAAVRASEGWGASRIAGLLAERAGVAVGTEDVVELAARGLLPVVGEYKGWPLYSVGAAEGVDVDLVAALVAERTEWMAASLGNVAAAEYLGWRLREFAKVVKGRGIEPGRFARYALADLDALKADEDLAAQVEADRLIGPDQAADLLEIRRSDWDHVVAAGWVKPAEINTMKTGTRRTVDVPMYRTADVRSVLDIPGVDWEEVRSVKAGQPSVLREFAPKLPTRAEVVKAFAQRLADLHGVEVWADYHGGADRWTLDWDKSDPEAVTTEEVRELLAGDTSASSYVDEIRLGSSWGRMASWARQMLEPDVAVILDTETTDLDGQIIEIAVVDAATGRKLLNSKVRATEPISAGAHAVHGLTDDDLVGAPDWGRVLPKLRKVTRNRTILAYNADFDRARVLADTERIGKRPMHLGERDTWACLMNARSDWLGRSRWVALGGSHRALGDCLSAREVLVSMAAGRGTAFHPAGAATGPKGLNG